jgi:hypothetical protein
MNQLIESSLHESRVDGTERLQPYDEYDDEYDNDSDDNDDDYSI